MTSTRDGLTIVERAARNIDHAAIEAKRRDEAAQATTERIKTLRDVAFRNASRGNREIAALTNEPAAAELLIRASENFDRRMVLEILKVAVDNQWGDVVRAGIRYFGEQPVAGHIHELWNLTT